MGRENANERRFLSLQTVGMARAHVLLLLLVALAALAAVSEGLVLCPRFPGCCKTGSCGILCPSCSEAEYFKNGVRIESKSPTRCGLNALIGDPYALVGADIFPSPLICI